MADDKPNARKLKTVPFRMSFPWLITPRREEDEKTKIVKVTHQLAMLYPPGTDLGPFKSALKAAMIEKFGEDQSKWPDLRHKPTDVIRDFARFNAHGKKPLPGDWSNWIMIRASSPEKQPPGIVGPTKGPDGKFPSIRDHREVYSGRWARASIDAYYFAIKGGGVTFGLKNVQLLKHDTNFSGAISAPEEDFDNAGDEWSGGASAPDNFEKGDPGNSGDDWN